MALIRRFEAKTFVLFLGLTLLSSAAYASRGISDDNGVFDITKFGARPDGTTDNAIAFIRAWNKACHEPNKNSKLLIPVGVFVASEVMFHGPCNNTVTIDVQGSVLADRDISNYPNHFWFSLNGINGLVIKGNGSFDAQGKNMWKYFSCRPDGSCDDILTPSFSFGSVHNVVIDGLRSLNSMGHHINIDQSSNITFRNVHIFAPLYSPHTDGIHVTKSQTINVISGDIETGGKCIFIGEGSGVRVDPTHFVCKQKL